MRELEETQKENSQKTIEDILEQSRKRNEELSAEKLKEVQDQVEASLRNVSS